MLGKDYRHQHITSADFLVSQGKVGFVLSDRVGDIRMLEYNPGRECPSSFPALRGMEIDADIFVGLQMSMLRLVRS